MHTRSTNQQIIESNMLSWMCNMLVFRGYLNVWDNPISDDSETYKTHLFRCTIGNVESVFNE